MAENSEEKKEENEEFDTLGIPVQKIPKKHEPSLIEEAEEMAENNVSYALAIAYFVIILVVMFLQLDNLTLFDFVGAIISAIFIFWAGFMSENFPIYQYISMTLMFLIFVLFQFLK